MDYSQMLTQVEDSEITIRVGELFGWNAYFIHPDGSVTFRDDRGRLKGRKNYCNNPSDAWPIIVENKIKIEPVRRVRNYNEWYEEWDASVNSPHFCESHKNPLRAAMIVFLLSQEDKHA